MKYYLTYARTKFLSPAVIRSESAFMPAEY